MTAVVALETVVLVLLVILVAGLLRSHAEILRRLHELGAGIEPIDLNDGAGSGATAVDGPAVLRPRGSRVPSARGRTLTAAHDLGGVGLRDDVVHVPVVGVGHRSLLAFLSSGCLTCRTFWDALHDPTAVDADTRVVIVTKDPSEESISELRKLAPDDVPVVMSGAAWLEYDVPGSPYFVLVDGPGERVLGEGTGMHWDQVRTLMDQALHDATGGDDREGRIDRELLANGIRPGDPSLYRTADDIARDVTHPE